MANFHGFASLNLPLAELSLPIVLKCGQSFRWQCIKLPVSEPRSAHGCAPTVEIEWRLTLPDRVVCLRQENPDTLYYRALFPNKGLVSFETETERNISTLAWIRDYFQLDVTLKNLYTDWGNRDPAFATAASLFEGEDFCYTTPLRKHLSNDFCRGYTVSTEARLALATN